MPMRLGTSMPELSGATEWINGEPDREAMRDHPVLVHFWSVSCGICHDNMPQVIQWGRDYGPQGLQMVAIHMPRQESDMDVEAVREDIAAMALPGPVGIDNTHAVAEAFENQYVPSYFLFDREGKLVGRAAGYAGLQLIAAPLKRQFESA